MNLDILKKVPGETHQESVTKAALRRAFAKNPPTMEDVHGMIHSAWRLYSIPGIGDKGYPIAIALLCVVAGEKNPVPSIPEPRCVAKCCATCGHCLPAGGSINGEAWPDECGLSGREVWSHWVCDAWKKAIETKR